MMTDSDLPVITIKNRPSMNKIGEMVKERPYVAQLIQVQILYDLAGMMEDLLDTTKSMVPEGKTIPREYIVPSTRALEIDHKLESSLPWRSIDVTNNGPDELYVTINENRVVEKAPLLKGESMSIDFRAPRIGRIILSSVGSSSVKVRGAK